MADIYLFGIFGCWVAAEIIDIGYHYIQIHFKFSFIGPILPMCNFKVPWPFQQSTAPQGCPQDPYQIEFQGVSLSYYNHLVRCHYFSKYL